MRFALWRIWHSRSLNLHSVGPHIRRQGWQCHTLCPSPLGYSHYVMPGCHAWSIDEAHWVQSHWVHFNVLHLCCDTDPPAWIFYTHKISCRVTRFHGEDDSQSRLRIVFSSLDHSCTLDSMSNFLAGWRQIETTFAGIQQAVSRYPEDSCHPT